MLEIEHVRLHWLKFLSSICLMIWILIGSAVIMMSLQMTQNEDSMETMVWSQRIVCHRFVDERTWAVEAGGSLQLV